MVIRVFAVLVLLAAVASVLVYRGSATVTVSEVGDNHITAECTGWTGVDAEGCATWGAAVWAAGAPSTTFDNADVVRIGFDRGTLGVAERCTATWFVSRYPDDPAWREEVPCRP